MKLSEYIVARLQQQGVDALFGVVGFPCARFFAAAQGKLRIVATSSDLEAGYAADGYARLRGLSVVSVSYGPGTLSIVNALAAAYVEKSAVLVVSGGPGAGGLANEKNLGVLFSHSTGRDATDFCVAEQVTALAVRVRTGTGASVEVDRAIVAALTNRRPVYLEIAQDLWDTPVSAPGPKLQPVLPSSGHEQALADEILRRVAQAHHPVLLLGEEIQRFGLGPSAEDLLARWQLPWATTTVAKGMIPEQTARFVGVYSGRRSAPNVRAVMEGSDYLVALGGVFSTGYLDLVEGHLQKMCRAYDGFVRLDQTPPVRADLGVLLEKLRTGHAVTTATAHHAAATDRPEEAAESAPLPDAELTHDEMFRVIRGFIDPDWLFIADTYLSITPAANVPVMGRDAFMADAAWASIGHSVGAAVGAAFATNRRPLVLCGDGGFQMTSMALSTMARHGQRSVVVVIDNGLYGYEQFLLDSGYYTHPSQPPLDYAVLKRWDYPALARAMGVKFALSVDTPQKLTDALAAARGWDGPGLIAAVIKAKNLPHELQ